MSLNVLRFLLSGHHPASTHPKSHTILTHRPVNLDHSAYFSCHTVLGASTVVAATDGASVSSLQHEWEESAVVHRGRQLRRKKPQDKGLAPTQSQAQTEKQQMVKEDAVAGNHACAHYAAKVATNVHLPIDPPSCPTAVTVGGYYDAKKKESSPAEGRSLPRRSG